MDGIMSQGQLGVYGGEEGLEPMAHSNSYIDPKEVEVFWP